jgi:CheY-like chemotaxis protein
MNFHAKRDFHRRVRKASSGTEGLESIRRGGVRLVLVDYDMPGMNGVEFCRAPRRLKHSDRTPDVITARTEQALLIRDTEENSGSLGKRRSW